MADDDFMAQALAYQPPGAATAASSVSPAEPSADAWPPVQDDALGPGGQLAAPPAPPPVDPAVGGSTPGFAPPIPAPTHGQQIQTVRTVTPAPGEAQALAQAGRAAGDVGAAEEGLGAAKKDQAEALAQLADDAAVQARLDAQEEEDKRAEEEAKVAKVRELADKAEADVAGFKFHDYGSDKSLGDRVIASIARALGSFNLSGNHPNNEIAERQQRAVDRDFDKQKLDLMSKENIAKWRREGVTDAASRMNEEMGALKVRQAKFHEAIAAKALAMQIRAGVPVEEAEASVMVAKNRAQAAKLQADALKDFRGSVTTQYGTAKAAKGGGTGGVGGGSSSAETALMKQIEDAKTSGKPMSQAEIYTAADKLKLPHEAKAGRPSVANVLALTGKITTTGAAEKRGALMDDRQFLGEVKNFEAQNNTAGMNKMRQKFAEARTLLKSGNGMGAMAALMEADGAARGAQATESSMHALQERSGGTWDKLKGWVEKGESGNFGAEQLKNIGGMIDAGEKGVKETQAETRKRFHESLGEDDRAKKAAAGIFGAEEKIGGGALAKGSRKKQGGHVYEFQGGDPKDPNAWSSVP